MLKKKDVTLFFVLCFMLAFVFVLGCIDVARADDTSLVTNLPEVATTSDLPNYVVFRGTASDGTEHTYAVVYNRNYDGSVQSVWTRNQSGHIDNGKTFFCSVSGGKCYHLADSSWIYECDLDQTYPKATFDEALFSNLDIYNQDKTTIFFQRTPCQPMVGGMAAHQIVEALTAEWTGLIPLAVGLVVLVVALLKGLQSLYRLLKTA